MSYILEALKLSEQTRRQGAAAPPTSLMPPANPEEAEPERAWVRYLLAAALLLVNIAAIALWQRPVASDTAAGSPTAAIETRPVPSAEPPVKTEPRADSPSPTAPPTVTAPPPTPAPRPAPIRIEAAAKAARPPADTAPAPATPKTDTGANTAATDPAANDGLPPGLQRQLPPLAVTGFIQDADQNNVVIVNDKLVREGDEAAPGVRLEKILPDGVVFSFQGHQFKR